MLKSLIAAALGAALMVTPAAAETAQINGLEMYYEVHGDGPPLVLLHGAYMSIDSNWDALIPTFAETHKVIAVELQAHGHTSDRDTPITYEGMSEDVAALLDHLEIDKAAVFGYSMGASVGIRLAMDHPEKVERLIVASGGDQLRRLPRWLLRDDRNHHAGDDGGLAVRGGVQEALAQSRRLRHSRRKAEGPRPRPLRLGRGGVRGDRRADAARFRRRRRGRDRAHNEVVHAARRSLQRRHAGPAARPARGAPRHVAHQRRSSTQPTSSISRPWCRPSSPRSCRRPLR